MRPKILVVTSWYPDRGHPAAGIFVREQASAAGLFADVAVLHLGGVSHGDRGAWSVEELDDPGLYRAIATYRLTHPPYRVPGSTYILHSLSILSAFSRLQRAGFRPDLLHAHVFDAGAQALVLSRVHGLPLVVTEHLTAFHRGTLTPKQLRMARYTFGRADRTLPVSQALRRDLEARGVRARFRIIPNVVDPAVFRPAEARGTEGAFRFLFVGGMSPPHVKGVPTLLGAMSRLAHPGGDWSLDLVGDGPARTEYGRLAADLGLADRIHFHGWEDKEAVARRMREADCLVLPSSYETAGCVLMEALASGTPVVACQVGGVPEIVDDQCGILVPPGDESALLDALRRMLRTRGRWSSQVLADKMRRFHPEVVGAMLRDVYAEVLGRADAPAHATSSGGGRQPSPGGNG